MEKEKNKSLSLLTSWKIGGPASLLLIPESKEELVEGVKIGKEAGKFYIIGNGTNILAKDEGFSYPLIKLGKNFAKVEITGNLLRAGAAAPLITLAMATSKEDLAGLEFASGIPGTLGGGIIMNAGAHGMQMKDIVLEVVVYDIIKEKYKSLKNKEIEFAYRSSIFKNNSRFIIIEVLMELYPGDKDILLEKIKANKSERLKNQPYEYPNCGSVFKNPPGLSAGKLIEDANLKGFSINDAEVSLKHGNFIINKGNASAKDIMLLIEHVEKVVKEKYNINLEREVIILE